MEAQDHQAVQGHPKVVIVAAATTITEATGTELFFVIRQYNQKANSVAY